MSVGKSWAYLDEFGPDWITAWAITQERAKYGGRSLGRTYWSTHKPGHRKVVKQVQTDGATFFAYMNSADAASGDGGESFSHRLFKEAIAGLSGTRLKLGSLGEHDIAITFGETEKAIQTTEGKYYADAYLRFTSTTSLATRWSGEVYIEVHHTHAVPVEKVQRLRQLRVPVVEVSLSEIFEYPFEDKDTTDERQRIHVDKIRNVLQKGFLAGKVISDPRSAGFLEQEVARLEHELQKALSNVRVAEHVEAEVREQLTVASARVTDLEKANASSAQRIVEAASAFNELQQELGTARVRGHELGEALAATKGTITALRKRARFAYLVASGVSVCMVGSGAFLSYRWLTAEQPVARTVPVAQAAQPAVPGQVVPAKRPSAATPKHHRHAPKKQAATTDSSQTEVTEQ